MAKEYSSFANATEIKVTHNVFELDVDFDAKIITGTAQVGCSVHLRMPLGSWALDCKHLCTAHELPQASRCRNNPFRKRER